MWSSYWGRIKATLSSDLIWNDHLNFRSSFVVYTAGWLFDIVMFFFPCYSQFQSIFTYYNYCRVIAWIFLEKAWIWDWNKFKFHANTHWTSVRINNIIVDLRSWYILGRKKNENKYSLFMVTFVVPLLVCQRHAE